MLSKSDLSKLQKYFSTQPIEKAYLFGSYARNEENEKSDLDILVEIVAPIGLLKFFKIKNEIEDLVKRRVDLLEVDGISKHIAPYIEAEKRLIYEKSLQG